MNLSILYRGPLSSCNYGCWYCPFAKHKESRAEHEADRRALERFINWVSQQRHRQIGVLFTPWGEALIRPRYQRALQQLTQMPHVAKAAIQTNLSCRLDWVEECDRQKLALWATYHPSEISFKRFVARCHELHEREIRFSVGVVGLKEQVEEIERLRRELPQGIYLWVNAFKRVPDYYEEEIVARLTHVDPLFPINNQYHPSLDRACRGGHTVISVDGEGTMRRCHFVKSPLGNIYQPDWEAPLQPRLCPNRTCGCHIGYVHMEELGLYELFGTGVLERVPDGWPDQLSTRG